MFHHTELALIYLLLFETGSYFVAQAGLELGAIFLSQPPNAGVTDIRHHAQGASAFVAFHFYLETGHDVAVVGHDFLVLYLLRRAAIRGLPHPALLPPSPLSLRHSFI